MNIGLFARNLEDELQVTRGLTQLLPSDLHNGNAVNVNRPRTFGIGFGYEF